MFDLRKKTNIRWWPSPQDYNEAVQNPAFNLYDPELKEGQVYLDNLGLPRPVSGAFASVYRLKCRNKDVALRCFLHDVTDQQERYAQISKFVLGDDLPYTVGFEYLQHGIQVCQQPLPALKMDWVEGWALDQYLYGRLGEPLELMKLSGSFLKMMDDLKEAGIAHGDLQHGNIIVLPDGEFRLVDYDGMYVPSMQGMHANELGHINYQHPQRKAESFGPYLDNFSAWVIYGSIKALASDPGLWSELMAGDDCLLFRRHDFEAPLYSPAFAALEEHKDLELQKIGRFIRGMLSGSIEAIPYLKKDFPEIKNLDELKTRSKNRRLGSGKDSGLMPDWAYSDPGANKILTEPDHFAQPASGQTAAGQPSAGQTARKQSLPHWASNFSSQSIVHKIDPVLNQPCPRPVEFNKNSGRSSPFFLQFLMFVNPILWFAVISLFSAYGVDQDLKVNGQYFPGKIVHTQAYKSKSNDYLTVYYQYYVNGQTYGGSESGLSVYSEPAFKANPEIKIWALASKPELHEPLFKSPGQKQASDKVLGMALAAISLILEVCIWGPALYHRFLVQFGTPVLAEVKRKWSRTLNNSDFYYVNLAFKDNLGTMRTANVRMGHRYEWERIAEGDIETVLYFPALSERAVIYRSSPYKVKGKTTASQNP